MWVYEYVGKQMSKRTLKLLLSYKVKRKVWRYGMEVKDANWWSRMDTC